MTTLATRPLIQTTSRPFDRTKWFATPSPIARAMLRAASLGDLGPHDRVLEPSAGRGALARLLVEEVGPTRVYVVERDPDCYEHLYRARMNLLAHDLMAWSPDFAFARIVMTPPAATALDGHAYVTHVHRCHQMLEPGGILVAVVPDDFLAEGAPDRLRGFGDYVDRFGVVAPLERDAMAPGGAPYPFVMLVMSTEG